MSIRRKQDEVIGLREDSESNSRLKPNSHLPTGIDPESVTVDEKSNTHS